MDKFGLIFLVVGASVLTSTPAKRRKKTNVPIRDCLQFEDEPRLFEAIGKLLTRPFRHNELLFEKCFLEEQMGDGFDTLDSDDQGKRLKFFYPSELKEMEIPAGISEKNLAIIAFAQALSDEFLIIPYRWLSSEER